MKKAKSVAEYLKSVPADKREALQKIRKQIKEVVPGATETFAWGLPCFKYRGKYIAGIAAYKNHCSFAPFSGLKRLISEKELAKYEHTAGLIHFTREKMLPASLVKKIVRAKVRMIEAGKARM